jgi:hypothetical protein
MKYFQGKNKKQSLISKSDGIVDSNTTPLTLKKDF